MKIKLFLLISLFFLNNSFFVNGMEVVEVAIKEDLKQARRGSQQHADSLSTSQEKITGIIPEKKRNNDDIALPMSRINKKTPTVQEMTDSGITSRSDGKFTPRNIDEIRILAKVYSNKVANQRSPKRIRITRSPVKDPVVIQDPVIIQEPVIIQDPVIKNDPIVEQEHISEEVDIHKIAQALADKTHIEPAVLADTILKLHGENDKAPLVEETEGYQKMYEKNENEYKDLVIELFKMVLLNDEESELSGESGKKMVDTHVGLLRRAVDEHRTTIETKNRTIEKKTTLLYFTRIIAGISTLVSTGLAIWAAYAQSHSNTCPICPNSTIV